jgi:nicotinamide riboside kinase
MARRGEKPSVMLHAIIAVLGPEAADRPVLVRYFSEAFCFQEGQAYKIFGWFLDGTGALKDSDIDSLLSGRIQETRAHWDERGPNTVEEAAPSRE